MPRNNLPEPDFLVVMPAVASDPAGKDDVAGKVDHRVDVEEQDPAGVGFVRDLFRVLLCGVCALPDALTLYER